MKRLRNWERVGPEMASYRVATIALLVVWFFGSEPIASRFGTTSKGPFIGLALITGLGGWAPLLNAAERMYKGWDSLHASARVRGRALFRGVARWTWAYCLVWAVALTFFAFDLLPYRNPGLWVAAAILWCIGLWAALRLRRGLKSCLSQDPSTARRPDTSASR